MNREEADQKLRELAEFYAEEDEDPLVAVTLYAILGGIQDGSLTELAKEAYKYCQRRVSVITSES